MKSKKEIKEKRVRLIANHIDNDVIGKRYEIGWLLDNIPNALFESNYKDIYEKGESNE